MTTFFSRKASMLVCVAGLFSLSLPVIAQSVPDYEKALEAFNRNQVEEAYIHLKNALNQDPTDLSAQLLMAKVLYEKAQFEEAIALFNEASMQGADPNLTRVPLAKALLASQQFEAIGELQLTRLNTFNAFELRLIKAAAFERLEQFADAESMHKAANSMNVDPLRSAFGLAHFYIRTSQLTKAEKYMEVARAQAPNSADTLQLLGRYLLASGKAVEALDLLQKALAVQPNNPLFQRSLASAYIATGQYSEAKELIGIIVEQTPGSPKAQLLKGVLALKLDDAAKGSSVLNELADSLSLVPSDVAISNKEIQVSSALTAYVSANYEQAQAELESILERYPDYLPGLVLLADTLIKLNEQGKALELLDKRRHKFSDNVPMNMLLCQLFINQRRVHRCDTLLTLLSVRFSNNPSITLMQVNVLTARERHDEALSLFETAFPSPTDVVLLTKNAQLLVNLKRYEEALTRFTALLELAPDNVDLMLSMAKLHTQLGQYDVAESLLSQASALAPDSPSVSINQARVSLARGKLEEAEKLLRSVPQAEQTEASKLLLGRTLLAQQGYEDAERVLSPLQDTSSSAADLLVEVFIAQNDFEAALAVVERQLRKNRLSDKYIQMRASLLLDNGDKDKAKRELSKLYGIWIEDAGKLVELARLQKNADDSQGAIRSLEQALKKAPESVDAMVELTRVLLRENDVSAAKVQASALRAQVPDSAISLIIDGEVAEAEGDMGRANRAFIKALKSQPSYRFAAAKLYEHAMKGVNETEFVTLMQAHLNAFVDAHFQRNLLADYYLSKGELDAAKPLYQALLDADIKQNRNAIMNNLASILIEQEQDLVLANQLIESALSSEPNDPVFIDTKGWLLAKQTRYEEALRLLRQAFARNTNDPSVRYHLAYTLDKLGQTQEATQQLRQAIDLEKAFVGEQNALALCRRLGC